jgi:hypothetical protein
MAARRGMSGGWLAQLAPERAPRPPSWWPPAPGWWILFALALVFLAAAILWRRYAANSRLRRARRAALLELERIRASSDANGVRALQRLMRRYALAVYGARRVANLTGESWLRFVEAHGGAAFGGERGERFLEAAFGRAVQRDQSDWISGAEAFFRHSPRGSLAP